MVRTSAVLWICAFPLILSGCKDKAQPAVIVNENKPVAIDPAANLPLAGNPVEQLQVEAAARPQGAIKAEAVIDALGKAEIVVSNNKQFIGRTVLANYCFGGISGKAMTVTICEYASAEAAAAGLENSQKRAGSIPNRTLTQNKQTVLTLVRDGDSAENKAEADKAIEVFSKL